MHHSSQTCWTLIRDAAAGRADGRIQFGRNYASVVHAYLSERWGLAGTHRQLDDALQEVFMRSFETGPEFDEAEAEIAGGFRAYLYEVTKSVALQHDVRETQEDPDGLRPPKKELPSDEELSTAFDRAWRMAILRQAVEQHGIVAAQNGAEGVKSVEVLRLRFQEHKSLEDIAKDWQKDRQDVEQQYTKARREFEEAMNEVLSFYTPGAEEENQRECQQLLQLMEC